MKKLKYLRWLRNPKSIPSNLQKKFDDHPQKQAIQTKAMDFYLNKIEHRPFLKALDKCVEGKKLSALDKRSLKNLVKIMQKGKGYTERTRDAIMKDIPELFNRYMKGKQTEQDKKDIIDVQEFVRYLMSNEKVRQFNKINE